MKLSSEKLNAIIAHSLSVEVSHACFYLASQSCLVDA